MIPTVSRNSDLREEQKKIHRTGIMKYIFIITISLILASCGPSAEEKLKVEMERQRVEQEANEKLAEEKANRISAVTCSIMGETRNMDAAVRVREMNDAREKIGGEPFLGGDDAIKEAFEWGLCQELVLNENYDETLQTLKDAKRERERIAAEKRAEEQRIAAEKRAEEQRIAAEKKRISDAKPSVKEESYPNGKLKKRTNYQSVNDGGERHGLSEWYYENGQLWQKRSWKDGKQHGLEEVYHENGQLWQKRSWKDGKKHGLWETYDENGQLERKGSWKDGKEDGFFEWYYKNGQLWLIICHKNGERTDDSYCKRQ